MNLMGNHQCRPEQKGDTQKERKNHPCPAAQNQGKKNGPKHVGSKRSVKGGGKRCKHQGLAQAPIRAPRVTEKVRADKFSVFLNAESAGGREDIGE